MKTNKLYKIFNYIGSILPLIILLPLINIYNFIENNNHYESIISITIIIFLTVISILSIVLSLIMIVRTKTCVEYKCTNITKSKPYVLEYLLTIIIPLAIFDISKPLMYIPLFFVLIFIGCLYIKYDLNFFNLYFELLGYHCYNVDLVLLNKNYANSICYIKSSAELKDFELFKPIGGDTFIKVHKN